MRYHLRAKNYLVHLVIVHSLHNYVSMSLYAFLLGCRVGEAGHPGPVDDLFPINNQDDNIRVAIINPTAVYNKLDDILAIDAQCYCLAETSATETIQKTMTPIVHQKGFRPFWSAPVMSRQVFEFDRPAYRGESIGTCCLTNLPSRVCPVKFPDDLVASCRVSSCIIRMGALDVLVISIYGLTGSSLEAKKANDYLLASIFQYMTSTKLPTLIGGDFNIRPEQLASWNLFQQLGYQDAFEIFRAKFGYQLPPTCNGKTYNDTLLIPPILQGLMVDVQILQDCIFDSHSPMLVTFDMPQQRPSVFKWNMPRSWKELNIPESLVHSNYIKVVQKSNLIQRIHDDKQEFDETILFWSQLCEKAVESALKEHHQIDSLNQPLSQLPKAYRGRCIKREKLEVKHQNPVRYAADGSYNPNSLSYSMKSKQKVKQVRRLQSLYQSMDNHFRLNTSPPCYAQFLQWKGEWQCICNAKGYGSSWPKWILSFDDVEWVPFNVPTQSFVHFVLQITRHDAEHVCAQEQIQRQQSFHLKLKFDRTENFLKGTYKMLRPASFPPVQSVQTKRETQAKLMRSSKDCIKVLLEEEIPLDRSREIIFGDSTCELLDQRGKVVTLIHSCGRVPTCGCLSQIVYAMTPDEVGSAFRDYWAPFWNRDNLRDLQSDEPWEDFMEILQSVPPKPEFQIKLDDDNLWYKTVHKLKSNKATGYDGWSSEDLKQLPPIAISHLAAICQKLWSKGFNEDYMQARTVLLSKVEVVQHMGHTRPITILGQIYRLITKVLADQILLNWSQSLPPSISGGVPGRGSRLMTYLQQARIEHAIFSSQQMGGFVLDLVKAFNCLPRRPLVYMMNNLGVPIEPLAFWMKSLHNLSRLPQIGANLGKKTWSTTGTPEGDALSVCGMISVAFHYHEYLVTKLSLVKVGIYADNWGWLTVSQKQNFLALQMTLRYVHSIRMTIDFRKSWAWATSRDFRKALRDLELLLPDGLTEIQVLEDAKELGVQMKYNRKICLGPIQQKFEEAHKKLSKIQWIPTSIEAKARLIKAVWQKLFYGLEGLGVGASHFKKVRRNTVNAILGNHKQANPWIACHYLHKFVQDPQQYAITELLCIFRQLCEENLEEAFDILKIACHFGTNPPKQSWGPGTAMSVYLNRCGLRIDEEGFVHASNLNKVNIIYDTCRDIRSFVEDIWHLVVQKESDHRKGISPTTRFHRNITLKVLSDFKDDELRGLFLNITGGYQSGAAKHKCYEGHSDKCMFCDAVDTKEHRLLGCPYFQKVRDRHREAIMILLEEYPQWIWHPIALQHGDTAFFQSVITNRPRPNSPDLHPWKIEDGQKIQVYTDGSCCLSSDIQARRSGYAIILDFSQNDTQRLELLQQFARDGKIPDVFQVFLVAQVSGKQTPARGELSAVTDLVKGLAKPHLSNVCLDIHTDASYVIQVIKNIVQKKMGKSYQEANSDLLRELKYLWDSDRFSLIKVKAHEPINEQTDQKLAWQKLGNFVADEVAKSSLKSEVPFVKDMSKKIGSHNRMQKDKLLKVYRYLVDFNHVSQMSHQKVENKEEIENNESPINPLNRNIREIMKNWRVHNPKHFAYPIMTPEIAQCCPWGMWSAYTVYRWLQTLEWPDDNEIPRGDVGITFLELYANFTIVMGQQLPVTVCRRGSRLIWEHFDSASAHLQPKRSRAAIAQGVVLDSIVKQIEKALGIKLWCAKKKTGIKTLSHLGQSFLQKRPGYLRRPSMLHADLTVELVDRFLHQCKDNHNYNMEMVPKLFLRELPLPLDVVFPDPLVELTPDAVVYHKKNFFRRCRQNGGD